MTIVNEKAKTMDEIYVELWSDTAPANLKITGADIGRDGTIAVGSVLETPEKRYKMGEAGAFVELEW